MAILKSKDIEKMSEKEMQEKLNELKIELVRTKVASGKGGKINAKEIKRTIARLLTFNRLKNKSIVK
jgi:ribosomal protein L29